MVILSRSISSRARSGSKWCIITSLPPAVVFDTRMAWHPVAWKSGTEGRLAFWPETRPSRSGHLRRLRPDGCPGGVEDGGVVIWGNLDVWERAVTGRFSHGVDESHDGQRTAARPVGLPGAGRPPAARRVVLLVGHD